ncbi:hypothetical protein LX36DRAFT_661175 [Colletotrichum falcatum]|nr:hypothetical protein LX36DRAFT_661175 [Colletotrichum falcatum]
MGLVRQVRACPTRASDSIANAEERMTEIKKSRYCFPSIKMTKSKIENRAREKERSGDDRLVASIHAKLNRRLGRQCRVGGSAREKRHDSQSTTPVPPNGANAGRQGREQGTPSPLHGKTARGCA